MIWRKRQAHSRGHYSPNRFSGRKSMEALDEICMNPDEISGRTDEQPYNEGLLLMPDRGLAVPPVHDQEEGELENADL